MTETTLLLLAFAAFAYALVARRLADGVITPPMVFLGLGLSSAFLGGEHNAQQIETALHVLAEITLILVLFSDAAMVKTAGARAWLGWAGRMLVIGLPLAMLFGFLAGLLFLPGWPVWEVAILAAILAPTDAALGQAVVTNRLVPERIREALTVESGVNDGLALPAVLFFSCMAVEGVHDSDQSNWLVFSVQQVGLGAIVGGGIGALGGWLIGWAQRTRLSSDIFEGIAVLALAALAYLGADAVGGNGFLATFAAGLGFGFALKGHSTFILEFIETEGQLLVLLTFLLLGLALTPELLGHVQWSWVVLILISLFITRPLAIALSLIGTDAPVTTRLFMGWFGPRGLATALFALLVLIGFDALTHGEEILLVCFTAVVISAVLHGVTAAPGARWMAVRAAADPMQPGLPSSALTEKEPT
jgi:NhaP-type Na+/H+ or K+/H+ antiporter